MDGHVGNYILDEKEKNRSRDTALEYDPKEDEFLIYCPLCMNHLGDYTKTTWSKGLSTEAVTEDKVWGFLFYQSHRATRCCTTD